MNEIWVGDKRLIRDALLLEKSDRSRRTLKERMRSYSCYATLFLVGPRVVRTLRMLATAYDKISVYQQTRPPGILWSLSRVLDGGVVRIAGDETEQVKVWIKTNLRELENDVGVDIMDKALL